MTNFLGKSLVVFLSESFSPCFLFFFFVSCAAFSFSSFLLITAFTHFTADAEGTERQEEEMYVSGYDSLTW